MTVLFVASLAYICQATLALSDDFKEATVLETDWQGVSPADTNVTALANSKRTCSLACLLMGEECMGFKVDTNGQPCELGKVVKTQTYISEFDDGTVRVLLRKDKFEKVVFPNLVSLYKTAAVHQGFILGGDDASIPGLEVPAVPYAFTGSTRQPTFAERYQRGILACGGLEADGITYNKSCWYYSLDSKEWQDRSPMKYGHIAGAATFLAGRFFAFGGYDESTTATPILAAEVYEPAKDEWRELAAQMPADYIVFKHKAVAMTETEILLVMGKYYESATATRHYRDFSYEYDIKSDSYGNKQTLPLGGTGLPEFFHCARYGGDNLDAVVCAGGQIIPDGGGAGAGDLRDRVYLYSLESRTWSYDPQMALPSPDIVHFVAVGADLYLLTNSKAGEHDLYLFVEDDRPPCPPGMGCVQWPHIFWEPAAKTELSPYYVVAYPVKYTKLLF